MSENWSAIFLKFAIQSYKMVQHYCKIASFQPHYRSIHRIYFFLIALRTHYCHRIIWHWPLYGSCYRCNEDFSPVTLHVLRKDKNNFSSLPTAEISLLCTFTMQKWSSAVWSGRPKTEILNNPCVLCIRMVVFLKSSGTWIATTQHQDSSPWERLHNNVVHRDLKSAIILLHPANIYCCSLYYSLWLIIISDCYLLARF